MSINLDIVNYLNSIVPEWIPDTNVTGNLLKRIVWNMNKTFEEQSLTNDPDTKPLDLILKIETMIRTCSYIELVAIPHLKTNKGISIEGIEALNNFKDAEFTWYKNALKNLGIEENPKERNYQNQILELVQLVKKYSGLTNDINVKGKRGRTPFLHACMYGDLDRMRMLKSFGADTKITDNSNDTSLHLAVYYNNNLSNQTKKDILQFLLQDDVDINAKNIIGHTPLFEAANNGNLEYAQFLIENGADLTIVNDYKETPLHIACLQGNLKIIELLLEKDINLINAKNIQQITPLFYCISKGHNECAKLLIENGADLTIVSDHKETSLHVACTYNSIEIVELLLEKNPWLINEKDENGYTPFLTALIHNNATCAKLLIEKGADVSIANAIQKTCIETASFHGYKEIIEIILQQNPELINLKDDNGNTLLQIAINNGHIESAKLLIENGADVTVINKLKQTPLHLALNGNKEIIELFLNENPWLINERDINGATALHYALARGHIECAKLLIEKGADVTIIDQQKQTPLHLACFHGNKEIIELILEKDPKLINVKDNEGNTPLHYACFKGHTDCAKLLIEKGADISLANNINSTILNVACSHNLKEIIEIVLQKNIKLIDVKDDYGYTPLLMTIEAGHVECTKLLIENGADTTIANVYDQSALHLACVNGNKDIVDLILKKNPELINTLDNGRLTPVLQALFKGHADCAQLLIENGADITIANTFNQTSLHFACITGSKNILEILLKKKPEFINYQDKNGDTPLIYAIAHSNPDSAQLLIENNADVNISNNNKKTALHFAYENGLQDLFKELLLKNANPNVIDSQRISPLYQAIVNNDHQTIELLVKHGAQVTDVPTYDGNSIFSLLLCDGHTPLYRDLAEKFLNENKEIDLQKGDSFGNTPLHYVCKNGLYKFLKFFKTDHFFENNIYCETPIQFAFDEELWNSYPHDSQHFLELALKRSICDEEVTELIKKEGINGFLEYLQNNIHTFIQNDIHENRNPLQIAVLLNNPKLGRSIAKELGYEQFKKCLSDLPSDVSQSFKESIEYDLDYDHLHIHVVQLPEKPDEKEYQVDAILDIFKELTGYDPENQNASVALEPKFRGYFPNKEVDSHTDKETPIEELYKRLENFINDCKNENHINGIEYGHEKAFWEIIERAITNTIKSLKTFNGSEEEIYEKKAQIMREYLSIIGYCATKLDMEFEKLYHLNSGIVRAFDDQIYFHLSEHRRDILESLAPRDQQSIHYIQSMLVNLSKYNIPIRQSHDPFLKKSKALNIEKSFEKKYLSGLVAYMKSYIESNKDIQDMFFQWLEENGREKELPPLPQEELSNCLAYITDHKGNLPSDAPYLAKDLIKYLDLNRGDDYKTELQIIQEDEINAVTKCLSDPVFLTQNDFEKVIENGDEAFGTLDPRLQKAIELSGFKDKLSETFKTKFFGRIHLTPEQDKQKKTILDKYKEINFPKMFNKVKKEDIHFLLEQFRVIKKDPLL